jgi:hypothetical protein
MSLVTILLAYNFILVAGYVHYRLKHARAEGPPPPKRMTRGMLIQFGIRQLGLAGLLALTFHRGDWTLESVGIRQDTHWLDAFIAGEIGYLLLIVTYLAILWPSGRLGHMRLVAVRGNLRAWPRGRAAQWFARLFIMVFNPFTEELVMRGVLIYQWGLLLGSPVIPILVGFVLNGALHWYQGWRMQLWHALYFVMSVSLLYSPWGLLAAIVAHIFGDVVPMLVLRRQLMRAYATRHAVRAGPA